MIIYLFSLFFLIFLREPINPFLSCFDKPANSLNSIIFSEMLEISNFIIAFISFLDKEVISQFHSLSYLYALLFQ